MSAATSVRCDGSCGYAADDGKPGLRCPNCDYGLLVPATHAAIRSSGLESKR